MRNLLLLKSSINAPLLWKLRKDCLTGICHATVFVAAFPVPEIIDPVFAKTSQNARFLLSENQRFGLVFVKTGSINSGTVVIKPLWRTVDVQYFYTSHFPAYLLVFLLS